jgi:hypothetical protein
VGGTQAAAMLGKTLWPKYLGSNRQLHAAPTTIKNLAQGGWCISDQTRQLGLRHKLKHQKGKADQKCNNHYSGDKAGRHETMHGFCRTLQGMQAAMSTLANTQMLTQSRQLHG